MKLLSNIQNTFLIFCFLLPNHFGNNANLAHGLYLSTIKITHQNNNPEKSGQATNTDIQLKVFTNDLQDVIHNFAPKQFKASDEKQFFYIHQKQIEQYFSQHLICQINAQNIPIGKATYELKNDVYLINFILTTPKEWKTISIKADYFMELFPTQSNIIHIENGSEKRFGKMSKNADSFELNF